MVGTATFTERGAGYFHYHEAGRLTRASGQILDAERRYIFMEEDDGFAVFFAETPPRRFHRVVVCREGMSLVGAATHLCGADHYDSRYEFRAGGGFVIEHRVHGPRKQYTAITDYARR